MQIEKSKGFTSSEALLSTLCDKVFLKAWCYANPFNQNADEICDLLAIFENHVYIFFDRNKEFQKGRRRDLQIRWQRWKRSAIDAQIKTAIGAERYLKRGGKIYLDTKQSQELPVTFDPQKAVYHKIIVAHGAAKACKANSRKNLRGSLAVSYSDSVSENLERPFFVNLSKKDKIHVLDTITLPIVLQEFDTVFDLSEYLNEKEQVIEKLSLLVYCGEEDLIAHYFQNFDEERSRHFIGAGVEKYASILVQEGFWDDFYNSNVYSRRREANKVSYVWDDLLQKTCSNALMGVLKGNGSVFSGPSAILEMAMEPRFHRRALSLHILKAINDFPDEVDGFFRNLSIMPSFYPRKSYVFLQLKGAVDSDIEEYRTKRTKMLEIACGTLKNKQPELDTIIGIAIDSPKHSKFTAEDFLLLRCSSWSNDDKDYYHELNKGFKFLSTDSIKVSRRNINEFPE